MQKSSVKISCGLTVEIQAHTLVTLLVAYDLLTILKVMGVWIKGNKNID